MEWITLAKNTHHIVRWRRLLKAPDSKDFKRPQLLRWVASSGELLLFVLGGFLVLRVDVFGRLGAVVLQHTHHLVVLRVHRVVQRGPLEAVQGAVLGAVLQKQLQTFIENFFLKNTLKFLFLIFW